MSEKPKESNKNNIHTKKPLYDIDTKIGVYKHLTCITSYDIAKAMTLFSNEIIVNNINDTLEYNFNKNNKKQYSSGFIERNFTKIQYSTIGEEKVEFYIISTIGFEMLFTTPLFEGLYKTEKIYEKVFDLELTIKDFFVKDIYSLELQKKYTEILNIDKDLCEIDIDHELREFTFSIIQEKSL